VSQASTLACRTRALERQTQAHSEWIASRRSGAMKMRNSPRPDISPINLMFTMVTTGDGPDVSMGDV
jgi:hypothetical protein